jgi:hypothetical protein
MSDDQRHDEEHLADLLALMRPAPTGWVLAAQQLPFARLRIDDLLERADQDQAFCDALRVDLERTLFDAGVAPTPDLVEEVRAHIAKPPDRSPPTD